MAHLRRPRRDPLAALLASFTATVQQSSFCDVRAHQRPPHGSIALGAAGVVAALLARAARSDSAADLALAGRWMHDIAASRSRSLIHGFATEPYTGSSLWFGTAGIHVMRVLVGLSGNEPVRARRALTGFVDHAMLPERSSDLVLGAAGNLIAASLLSAAVRDTGLDEVAARLADRVAAALPAARGDWSFAHGWPGLAFALLQHCRASGQAMPGELRRLLADAVATAAPVRRDHVAWLRGAWCNGVTGHVLLWIKAFELTRDSAFLDRARADMQSLPEDMESPHDLCCGSAGRAYACLALERVAPGEGWRRRALRIARAAVRADPRFVHASGLLQGQSGIVHLAADLVDYTPACGFPFVEALPIRAAAAHAHSEPDSARPVS